MANSKNILCGPNFTSSTFEEELAKANLAEYLVSAIKGSSNDTIMVS